MGMSITLTARMLRQAPRFPIQLRSVSTLSNNSHIYAFRDPKDPSSHILTFLSTEPPTPSIAIGSTSQLPPSPSSLKENPRFLPILQAVMAEHAHSDPFVQSQAAVEVGLFMSMINDVFRTSDIFLTQKIFLEVLKSTGMGSLLMVMGDTSPVEHIASAPMMAS